jgi:bacillithiol system protein YtxJ
LKKLETQHDWDDVKGSIKTPLLLIKLSPICPTSFSAERIFNSWAENVDESKISLFSINVIAARPLSRSIASELNITHQSPQAIFLNSDMKVISEASHYSIDESWLNNCLKGL